MWSSRPESSLPLAPDLPYRGRFAPSPTGPLHLGSLLAALGSWLMARRAGGEWLLRIEDIDPPRERVGMARKHIADLAAFGFDPDGPVELRSRFEPAERLGSSAVTTPTTWRGPSGTRTIDPAATSTPAGTR